MKVLNPGLYKALEEVFGSIIVANNMEQFRAKASKDVVTGRRSLNVMSSGEYYRVCCPKCKDSRHRLWFNHRWGTMFEGNRLDHLMICYNEECHQDPNFRAWVRTSLRNKANRSLTQLPEIKPEKNDGVYLAPINTPGRLDTLDTLPDDHVACQYLRSRGYDPKHLGYYYGVAWCSYSQILPRNNRLFFPAYHKDENGDIMLVGGQARWLARDGRSKPDGDEPKYYTLPGTKRSRILYNMYRAQEYDYCVIGEGALDAINAGFQGVAIWGKVLSNRHMDILHTHFMSKNKPVILGLDPEAHEETQASIAKFNGYPKLGVIPFGKDEDMGGIPHDELQSRIHRVLSAL